MWCKRIIVGLGAVAAIGAFTPKTSYATLLAYEEFTQAAGTNLATTGTPSGSGFGTLTAAGGGLGTAVVSSPGLTKSPLTTAGQTATLTSNNNGNAFVNLNLPLTTSVAGGSVTYISYLYNSTGGDQNVLYVYDGAALITGFGGDNSHFVQVDTRNGFGETSTGVLDNSGTHLLVEKIDQPNQTISLYVDPTPGTEPMTASAVIGGPSTPPGNDAQYNNAPITNLTFQASNAINFDEVRIGTTFADVTPTAAVPEPASLSLLAIGSVLGLRRRRRHAA